MLAKYVVLVFCLPFFCSPTPLQKRILVICVVLVAVAFGVVGIVLSLGGSKSKHHKGNYIRLLEYF